MMHIVVVGKEDEVEPFIEKINSYLPDAKVEIVAPDDEKSIYKQIENKVTAYVCEEKTCLPPATDPEQLEKLLKSQTGK